MPLDLLLLLRTLVCCLFSLWLRHRLLQLTIFLYENQSDLLEETSCIEESLKRKKEEKENQLQKYNADTYYLLARKRVLKVCKLLT